MATKKQVLSKEALISMYMNYTLENNERPKSVFQFTKANGISETEFYSFFGTLEAIENEVFQLFFEKTIALLDKDSNYESYDMKSKLLSFYFTFFELLSANRSYVVMTLNEHKNQLKNISKLANLRTNFKEFNAGIISDEFRTKQEQFQNFQEKAFQETSWIQFLLTLKFWMDDASASFEKTDIYIEKSVKASFELMNISPLDSLIDFGKFIFKEKIHSK